MGRKSSGARRKTRSAICGRAAPHALGLMSNTINVHATCVRIDSAGAHFGAPPQCGILLLGKSGSGKSDIALRLIDAGAELVADDRVELYLYRNRLHARP